MWGVVITLLIVFVVLSILGAVIEGLFWLLIIGVVLVVATAAWGWLRRRASRR